MLFTVMSLYTPCHYFTLLIVVCVAGLSKVLHAFPRMPLVYLTLAGVRRPFLLPAIGKYCTVLTLALPFVYLISMLGSSRNKTFNSKCFCFCCKVPFNKVKWILQQKAEPAAPSILKAHPTGLHH